MWTVYRRWMRHLHRCQEAKFSPNWILIVGFGRYLLTTFITPSRRYCFNKIPSGISSAPEHFQKRICQILTGLQGVLCLMDDVLVFGRDQKERDKRLFAALTKIQTAGVTLNPRKCEFNKYILVIS